MEMKKIVLAGILALSMNAMAHDEGHGPKLADTGKFGGLVSAVVAKADAKKGSSAAMVYKAELVRSSDGGMRVYLYDGAMKQLDLGKFEAKGKALVGSKVKGKWKENHFGLEKKDNSFEGKMPKPESKPYSIDVTITEGGKELLTAFDNLD
jgi:hypothetical protein